MTPPTVPSLRWSLIAIVTAASFAPTALAHTHAHVDVDIDVDVDLHVVARVVTEGRDGLTYTWDWGDRTATAVGTHARHAYESAGHYEVVLTIEDPETGDCWTLERVVRVEVMADRDRDRADDDEERDEEDNEEEDEEERASERSGSRARAGGSVRGGSLTVDASLGLGRARSESSEEDEPQEARSTRASGRGEADARHTVPGAGLFASLGGVAALALAFRRR